MATTVLCVIDEQSYSSLAVDHAVALARDLAAKLVVLMVNYHILPSRGSVIYRWEQWQIDEYFAEVRKRAWFAGVGNLHFESIKSIDVVDGVLTVANRTSANHLVVGSDYQKPSIWSWREPLSLQISRLAPCPTTIVHGHLKQNQRVLGQAEVDAA